ncbi:hypothetical protein C8R43DRAFT_1128845 [Mycena crocata]|nr:hypothetical protein C8R43DRAFT_1128845 [Mycena crocata]
MSLVSLNCIAVLENPRVPDIKEKPNSYIVDAQIYLNGSVAALVGCLRWYNAENFEFPEAVGAYDLWIQAAGMTESIEHHSKTLKTKDYHIAGDIIELTYLGPAEDIDLRRRAVLHALGTTVNPNSDNATFEIQSEQYLSALKAPAKIHFMVLIPDTPRYKKKTVPSVNSRVLVTGRIMDVEFVVDDNEMPISVKHFIVDMESFVFAGSKAPHANTPAPKIAKTEGTPAQLKFDFSKVLNTPSPAASLQKKRKEKGKGEAETEKDNSEEGSSKKRKMN